LFVPKIIAVPYHTLSVDSQKRKDRLWLSSRIHCWYPQGYMFAAKWVVLFLSPCKNIKSEREKQKEIHVSSVSPRVFKTFCMWFLAEVIVKTEPRHGGKEKGSFRNKASLIGSWFALSFRGHPTFCRCERKKENLRSQFDKMLS